MLFYVPMFVSVISLVLCCVITCLSVFYVCLCAHMSLSAAVSVPVLVLVPVAVSVSTPVSDLLTGHLLPPPGPSPPPRLPRACLWFCELPLLTGSVGATVRMYIEKYEPDVAKQGLMTADVLRPLVAIGLEMSKLESFTGRASPTVIT